MKLFTRYAWTFLGMVFIECPFKTKKKLQQGVQHMKFCHFSSKNAQR